MGLLSGRTEHLLRRASDIFRLPRGPLLLLHPHRTVLSNGPVESPKVHGIVCLAVMRFIQLSETTGKQIKYAANKIIKI